jgi:hypothetical protein
MGGLNTMLITHINISLEFRTKQKTEAIAYFDQKGNLTQVVHFTETGAQDYIPTHNEEAYLQRKGKALISVIRG